METFGYQACKVKHNPYKAQCHFRMIAQKKANRLMIVSNHRIESPQITK